MSDLNYIISQSLSRDNLKIFKHLLKIYDGDAMYFLASSLMPQISYDNPEKAEYKCLRYLLNILKGFHVFLWSLKMNKVYLCNDVLKVMFRYWKSNFDKSYGRYDINQCLLDNDIVLFKELIKYTHAINIRVYKNSYMGTPTEDTNNLIFFCFDKNRKDIFDIIEPYLDKEKKYEYVICNHRRKDTVGDIKKIQKLYKRVKRKHKSWIYMGDCEECFHYSTYEEIHKSLFLMEIVRVHTYLIRYNKRVLSFIGW